MSVNFEVCVTYRRQIFNLNCIIKSKIEKSESEAEKSLVEESEEETVIRSSRRLKKSDYSTRDFQENVDINPVKKPNVPSSITITRINNVPKPVSKTQFKECSSREIHFAKAIVSSNNNFLHIVCHFCLSIYYLL